VPYDDYGQRVSPDAQPDDLLTRLTARVGQLRASEPPGDPLQNMYRQGSDTAQQGLLASLAAARSAPVASGGGDTGGMNPAFAGALNRMIADSGGRLSIKSGYRSPERQAQLWSQALAKYGSAAAARKWVAPPGRSHHNSGTAADLGGDLGWAHANAARYGLSFPMSWENWHIEPQGSR